MAKRRKSVRRLRAARKAPPRRKLAPPVTDQKKQIAALKRELAEALERQTATSEVLQIISSTPGELKPVFEKMLESATRVCGAKFGVMVLFDGDLVRRVAGYNLPPASIAIQRSDTWRPRPQSTLGIVAGTKKAGHLNDLRKSGPYLRGSRRFVHCLISRGPGQLSPCRCSKKTNWLVQILSFAKRSSRSPTSTSRW